MVRLPKNLSTNYVFKSGSVKTGQSTLEHELLAEKAHSLGLAANKLTDALETLRKFTGEPDDRQSLVQSAANAAQAFFIQRELMGMTDHRHPIEHYAIPKDVLSRIGIG
jgi:hypothetical protein